MVVGPMSSRHTISSPVSPVASSGCSVNPIPPIPPPPIISATSGNIAVSETVIANIDSTVYSPSQTPQSFQFSTAPAGSYQNARAAPSSDNVPQQSGMSVDSNNSPNQPTTTAATMTTVSSTTGPTPNPPISLDHLPIQPHLRIPNTATQEAIDLARTQLRHNCDRTLGDLVLKIRAQFENTLLILLTLNVIYVYYIDHKLLVLIIRATQLFRLLWFPHSMSSTQRGTAVLLLISNLPILLVHKLLFSGPNISSNLGEMLFINFIGTEPKSLFKVFFVDVVTIILQAIILQCRWDPTAVRILSDFPVPASEPLIPIEDDPLLSPRSPSDSPAASTNENGERERERERQQRHENEQQTPDP